MTQEKFKEFIENLEDLFLLETKYQELKQEGETRAWFIDRMIATGIVETQKSDEFHKCAEELLGEIQLLASMDETKH